MATGPAMMSPSIQAGPPPQSVTTPPASWIRRPPAATSQGPRREFEEAVEDAFGDPGEVQAGRAGAAEVFEARQGGVSW